MKDMKNNQIFLGICKENHLNIETGSPQWEAVFADKNTVVSAGAGTGKTTVLSFRFLRLVAEEKAKPSEILTITFTRKATAEMKQRISELMQEAVKKSLINLELLSDFSNSAITTVDGFCSEIVRNNAVSRGVPRSFEILSAKEEASMADSIMHDILAEQGPETNSLLKFMSVSNLKSILLELSSMCPSFDGPLSESESFEKLKFYLEKKRKEYSTKISEGLYYSLPDFKLKPEYREAFERIAELSKTCDENTLNLILQNYEIVKYGKNIKLLKECWTDNSLGLEMCLSVLLSQSYFSLLFKLFDQFRTRLILLKRRTGKLTFSDIMKLTLEILLTDKKQRVFWRDKFKFIMIDEFQDNNDDYRKLLYLLSENPSLEASDFIPDERSLNPEKIFLVGDQKQSIYRFRGAEVSVFKKLTETLCEKPIELDCNWRSEPAVMNFCNDVFSKVLSNPSKVSYEADFSPLKPRPPKISKSHICFIKPKISDSEHEAYALAEFIKRICSPESTFRIPQGQADERVPRYSDIGILLRKTTNQELYEKAFNDYGIPYCVTEAKSLSKEAVAGDFCNALMCVLSPDDLTYRYAFLRSPFCCSSLEDLYNKKENPHAQKLLNSFSEVLRNEGLVKAVSYLWNEGGYKAFVLASSKTRSYTQHFDWLYAIACEFERNNRTAWDFATYLRNPESEDFSETTVFNEKNDGVQIMTIHKSKGLAFHIVVVAGIDGGSSSSGFQTNNSSIGGFLSFRCVQKDKDFLNPVLVINKEEEEAKELAELKRLLYVAATRPYSHLVFSSASFEPSSRGPSFFNLLSEPVGINQETPDGLILRDGYEIEITTLDAEKTTDLKKRTVPDVKFIAEKLPEAAQKVAATQLEPEKDELGTRLPALESDLLIDKYNLASAFGTRTHLHIECALNGLQVPEPVYPSDLSRDEIETLEKDSSKLAEGFLKSEIKQEFQRQGARFLTEVPIVIYDSKENRYIEGRIDLMCICTDCVHIVDFKTDRFKSDTKHEVQLELYKKAISLIPAYQSMNIVTHVIYLREKIE